MAKSKAKKKPSKKNRSGTAGSPGTSPAAGAEKVSNNGTELITVTVYQMRGQDKFKGRIDAERALLRSDHWELHNATITSIDTKPQHAKIHRIPTNLTQDKIKERFASSDTLSFWELPDFIKTLEDAGFDATSHRLRFHTLLATPLLFCSMVLIAATFSIRASRRTSLLLPRGEGGCRMQTRVAEDPCRWWCGRC